MKKIYLCFAILTLLATSLLAQVPQHLSWQGIVRDAAGNPLSTPVELRFTILNDITPVFVEEKALTPNGFGLVVWNIGEEQTLDFAAIDWAGGVKTLKVELRTTVGSGNYTDVGTEQLKSVPYALLAEKTLFDKDNQTITLNGNSLSISGGNVVDLPVDGDGSATNEIQTISLSGQTLSLSNGGGAVTLPTGADAQILMLVGQNLSISGGNTVVLPADGDGSATNEIQALSLSGQTLSLSNGGGSVSLPPDNDAQTLSLSGQNLSISGGNAVSLPVDGDGSATNEIQAISLSGQTLSLSNGGGSVTLPVDGDSSATNEIQALSISGQTLSLSNGGGSVVLPPESQTLTLSGQNLAISGGNSIVLPVDGDGSSTNEIQQLSISKDSLKLSNGGGFVTLKDTSSLNEIQTLSLTGTALSLSKGGGTVTLPGGASYQAGSGIYFSSGNTIINAFDNSETNELQSLSLAGNQLSLSQGGSVTLPLGYWAASGGNIYNTNFGNVGIGTSSPSSNLDVAGDININDGVSAGVAMRVNNSEAIWYDGGYYSWGFGGGNNYFNSVVSIETNVCCWSLEVDGNVAKPGGGSWSALSDIRYKQNVQPYTDGLDALLKINPVRYHYNDKSGYDSAPEYVGVIAQDLRKIAPYMIMEMPAGQLNGKGNNPATQAEATRENKVPFGSTDTYLSVDNSAMTYMLINGVKEQQAEIAALKDRVDGLEKRVGELLGKK